MNMSGWQLFWTTVAFGVIFYLVAKPFHYYSPDNAISTSYKMPLESLLRSGKERMTLQELYGGTMFEGDTMCMYYPYPSFKEETDMAGILLRAFPDMREYILSLNVKGLRPEWMVAVRKDKKLLVVTGRNGMKSIYDNIIAESFYKDSKDGEQKRTASSEAGYRCVDFEKGVFRVSHYKNGKNLWRNVILTDEASVADPDFHPLGE